MKSLRHALLAALLLACAGGAALWWTGHLHWPGSRREVTVSAENLMNVRAIVPAGDAQGVAIQISDAGAAPDGALTNALVERGLIVVPVRLDDWMAALQKDAEDCLYAGSDIEGIAKEVQHVLALDTYSHPVVVGEGRGGVLGYAAVADSPAATMAGGVALNAAATLDTRLPICDGAVASRQASGYAYDLSATLPEPFTFVAAERPAGLGADTADHARFAPAPDADAARAATADAALALAERDATAMPIIASRPAGKTEAVALFFSGDGGWRDLDKSIGDWFAQHGIAVIGVDSLRYFWSEKTPQQMGDDIGAILDNAMIPKDVPVAIMGYSFGADTLPFAWPSIPKAWRDRTDLIALLAPGQKTGFEISVGGWFGMATGEKPVVPAVAALPQDKLLCVYGEEDDETACTAPSIATARKIETGGGHHFDEDYDALAAKLRAIILGGKS